MFYNSLYLSLNRKSWLKWTSRLFPSAKMSRINISSVFYIQMKSVSSSKHTFLGVFLLNSCPCLRIILVMLAFHLRYLALLQIFQHTFIRLKLFITNYNLLLSPQDRRATLTFPTILVWERCLFFVRAKNERFHWIPLTNVLVLRVSQLKTEFLPLLSVSFVSENSVVAAVSVCFSSLRSSVVCWRGRKPHILHS